MALNTTVSNTNEKVSIALWLDSEINRNEESRITQQQLRTIIKRLETFKSKTECEKYIRSVSSQERLLLIVSGRMGIELVPDIHALQQVTSIYVYCQHKEKNEQWTKQFTKVKAVVTQQGELISRIRTSQEDSPLHDEIQTTRTFVIIDAKKQSTACSIPYFAYSQLLSNVLLRLKLCETDKRDLISLCRNIHKNSELSLQTIDEFQQNYISNEALRWYSTCPVMYKILNNALETQDVNKIFLFQFFIRDIYQQLTKHQCQSPIKVYRSQIISHNEIDSIKELVGCFISMNMFFSTILSRETALKIIASERSTGFHRVVFDIDADPKVVTTKPFADITLFSDSPQYHEVLFTIGSVFRVTSVYQYNGQIWFIRMTLCDDNDPDLKPYFEEIEEKYGNYNGDAVFLSFSQVLREMKRFNGAEKYCRRLLQHSSSNIPNMNPFKPEIPAPNPFKPEIPAPNPFKPEIPAPNPFKPEIPAPSPFKPETPVPSPIILAPHESANNLRYTDVVAENHDILLPIEGHERMPLVTLEEAVKPLISILPDIRRKVHTAKKKCTSPADGLTSDQSAAIMLYTMEWEPHDQCLYFALNASLREADRGKLRPWFLYLKLILTGLSHLPSIHRTVYRGVKLDLSPKYPKGEEFFWWGFSSCTTTIDVLSADHFFGTSGVRTLFHIECTNGKDIRRHSYFEKEDEVLLLPATYFQVVACFEMAPDLHAIQMKEIQAKFPYLQPVV